MLADSDQINVNLVNSFTAFKSKISPVFMQKETESKIPEIGCMIGEETGKGEARRKCFQSPCTSRDELIYCQICWWIIDNLSLAPQSTLSAISEWRSRSRDIMIKKKKLCLCTLVLRCRQRELLCPEN